MSRAGLIQFKGAAVTFTHTAPGTHVPSTGRFGAASTSSVAGYAMRVPGDPETYAALELIESKAITLEFTPTTVGGMPTLDSAFTFDSVSYTVRSVDPFAKRVIGGA